MLTRLFRVFKYGVQYFWRHGWLSAATIIVMILALLIYQGLILFGVVTDEAVTSLKGKIDIAVYFRIDAPEDQMLQIRDNVKGLPEVESVEYVSRDQALTDFKERHKDDPALTQALEELQANPLLASLNIQANDPKDYPVIAAYLQNTSFEPLIEKITFTQNRVAIERLTRIVDTMQKFGLLTTIFVAFAASLVAFNTIRLAIYSNREEIGIMRLVGASNSFIKGPYIISGIFYGVFGTIFALLLSAPIIKLIAPPLLTLIPEINLETYFYSNLFGLLLSLLLFGVGLGIISSWVAIRRYLKV